MVHSGLVLRAQVLAFVLVAACGGHRPPSVAPASSPSPAYSPVFLAAGFPACALQAEAGGCERFDASLVQLLARPELFDGQKVAVKGFVNLEFEGNALYLSREMFEAGTYRDAVWLDVEGMPAPPSLTQGWADIEGTFHAGAAGHFGAYSGSIGEITSIRRALVRKPVGH